MCDAWSWIPIGSAAAAAAAGNVPLCRMMRVHTLVLCRPEPLSCERGCKQTWACYIVGGACLVLQPQDAAAELREQLQTLFVSMPRDLQRSLLLSPQRAAWLKPSLDKKDH